MARLYLSRQLIVLVLTGRGRLFMRPRGGRNHELVYLVLIRHHIPRLSLLGFRLGFLSYMLRITLILRIMIQILMPLTRMFQYQ